MRIHFPGDNPGWWLASIAAVLIFFSTCTSSKQLQGYHTQRIFWSPYQEINWQQAGHFDAEFHTHPGLGDEQYDPHQTIDRYREEGYQILALAAHDYDIPADHMQTIYPWTKLSDIFHAIMDIQNPTENNKTYGEMANEPYQNRNPVELGMISVEGNEVSAPHHMVSLFCPVNSGEPDEASTIKKIKDQGGIAYFAHPGRYVETKGYTEHWYADLYLRFDNLIGQAVFNRVDTYPADRLFYDKIVHLLGFVRPIWLLGEDDMHQEKDLAWNRNVILIENFMPGSMHPEIQNGSAPDVYNALKKGQFYLWKPKAQYVPRAFNITNVKIVCGELEISIDKPEEVIEIRWITFNPDTGTSEVIHSGNRIAESLVPQNSRFVRAEIEGFKGTVYTQPFYLKNDI